jgi:hypothetical protein
MNPLSDYFVAIATFLSCILGGIAVLIGIKYKRQLRKRVEEVQANAVKIMALKRRPLTGSGSERRQRGERSRLASQFDLSSAFIQHIEEDFPGIRVASLGEYLDSIEGAGMAERMIPQKQLDVLIGAALIRILGPALGGVILPAVAMVDARTKAAGIQAAVVGGSHDENDTLMAGAARIVPTQAASLLSNISVFSVLGVADFAIRMSKSMSKEKDQPGDTPIQTILKYGEMERPTFTLPTPFVLDEHWTLCMDQIEIAMKEHLVSSQQLEYIPDEYEQSIPKAINEVLLPDLHIGPGQAFRTHTRRQILQNRLFSVLLNRLTANLLHGEVGVTELFEVHLTREGESFQHPSDFIQALMNAGYQVQCQSACRVTTFGFNLCVEDPPQHDEDTPTWVHIPVAMPLSSGITEDNGSSIPGYLTHSATDLQVSGPLFEGVRIENYHNQAGFAGWISAHYWNLPWLHDGRFQDLNPVKAVAVVSVLSACINSTAARMRLPNGGYGTIGVCNDSTAVVDQALLGHTNIYPLAYIGSFHYHLVKRVNEMANDWSDAKSSTTSADTCRCLHGALIDLPNDVHPIPRTFADTARRIVSSCPVVPTFVEMEESIKALENEFPDVKAPH